MDEFTPITTQEQLDAWAAGHYGDYDQMKSQREEDGKTIADLQAKVARYERDALKSRIAREAGLRPELAGRLTGETEKELRADAKALFDLVGRPAQPAAPLFSAEPAAPAGQEGRESAAFKSFANHLMNKGE